MVSILHTTKTLPDGKFAPVIKIGDYEYVFSISYDIEDAAAAKAYTIMEADLSSMMKSLHERQGRWKK